MAGTDRDAAASCAVVVEREWMFGVLAVAAAVDASAASAHPYSDRAPASDSGLGCA